MYILISYILQCLYSPVNLILLYTGVLIITTIFFKLMFINKVLENRTIYCLACDKLFPPDFVHCYKCHKCVEKNKKHVKIFRACVDEKLYHIWSSIRNTLLFLFCLYNIFYKFYTKLLLDIILIVISYL